MKFLEHRIPPPAVGLGIGALMWFLAALLGVPLFVLYINRFQIAPEERMMASLFGADYLAYKESVRRWI